MSRSLRRVFIVSALVSIALIPARPALGSETAKVAIAISSAPCAMGSVNCRVLDQGLGTILIRAVDGTQSRVAVDPSGLTITELAAGPYEFSYEAEVPGVNSQHIDQEIVVLGARMNFVDVTFASGIR